jgi:TolB-like protein/Tfp pilus assembly protein PilF
MAEFFAELKRRHIYRVGAAYVVVAWVLTQVIEILAQVFTLPLWIAQTAIVVLAIGFPVALLAAWTIESKPHQAVASAVRAKPTMLDGALFGALIIVGLLIGYQQIAPRQAGVEAAKQAGASQPGDISLAVLPFANLSGDASQEFFSDGMTEEITAALAKITNFQVVGRTSAFEFKGQNRDLRVIGQALNASHLIEGSVRKAGDRVRITAQLVRADNGLNLWTENYDRQLNDIFAVQEDIAQAIASALSVPLGLRQGENLVRNRTIDVESYDQYLRARALFRARGAGMVEAIAILESVVARDPSFAPAWALLAYAYILEGTDDTSYGRVEEARETLRSARDKADKAAREAVRLDPQYAGGHAALGRIELTRAKWAESEELFRRALVLDANDPETLHPYSSALATEGRLKESLLLREKLRTLEPFVPIYNLATARVMQFNGQNQATIPFLLAIPVDAAGGFGRNVQLARAYAGEGRYGEAADTLLSTPQQRALSRSSLEDAAALLRSAPAAVGAPESLPSLEGELNFVYAFVGAPDRAMESAERALAVGDANSNALRSLWHPKFAAIRKTARFKTLMQNAGLVDFWRAKGWPDLCRPVGADDFECD